MVRAFFNPSISGVSGDMILATLIEAGADIALLEHIFQPLGIKIEKNIISRHGVSATFLNISSPNIHFKTSDKLCGFFEENFSLPLKQKKRCLSILQTLFQAEADIHRASSFTLHELGSVDTLIDIVGCIVAVDMLGIHSAVSSPVAVGKPVIQALEKDGGEEHKGQAVAWMIKHFGIPFIQKETEHELTTPTGLAILVQICDFLKSGTSLLGKTYYGAGTADFTLWPNVLELTVV